MFNKPEPWTGYLCKQLTQFLRYASKILHTIFVSQEATHLSKPLYKLKDRNQVIVWTNFSLDKLP